MSRNGDIRSQAVENVDARHGYTYGPTHDPAWERFRAALNAPSTAWTTDSETPA